MEELRGVIEEYLTLVHGEENQRRKTLWVPEQVYSRDMFRRIPQPNRLTGQIPVAASPMATLWGAYFGFSVRDYYTDAKSFLKNYLKSMIALFEWGDDTTLDKTIPFWPGVAFDSSIFGMDSVYHDTQDPWVGREVPIKEKEDLAKMSIPDFYNSGIMPLVHKIYQEANDLLAPYGCRLDFPHIIRGPYGIAFHLRGFAELALDLMDDPEWVHQLMRYITDSHIEWYKERARFLGEPMPKVLLYNDEVDCNVIGPKIYEDYVLPYEIELSEFHGGTAYWHSCGNITPILGMVRKIPNLALLNISGWTDYHKAAKICPDIPLEICVVAPNDIYFANAEQMAERAKDIAQTCNDANVEAFYIRASGLGKYFDKTEDNLSKIREWARIVKKSALIRC